MRLIFSIFALPFWVFLAAAGGLFYLGELSYRDTLAQNQEMARALAGPPPETVSLAAFSRDRDIGPADEISVQAVIDPDYNYELTKRRKGINTVRYMYVLFDVTDPQNTKEARSAMVLTKAEKEKFVDEYYLENSEIALSETGFTSVTTFNGTAENSSDLSSLVSDAFRQKNLTKSTNFVYVEPFLDGRTAGLTPTTSADEMRNTFRSIALGAALIGLLKFVMRRRKKAAVTAAAGEAVSEVASSLDPVATPAMMAAKAESAEDPAKPKRGKLFPIKALLVMALLIGAFYFGVAAIFIVAALIILQVIAIRKTQGVITGVLAKLTGKSLPTEIQQEQVMANVQAAARESEMPQDVEPETEAPKRRRGFSLGALRRKPTEPEKDMLEDATVATESIVEETTKKRRFGLALPRPRLARKSTEESKETESVSAQTVQGETITHEKPKRGFSLPLPVLRRKTTDSADLKSEPLSAELETDPDVSSDTSKRGFKLSLPSLRRASKSGSDAASPKPKSPRQKAAFEAADLFVQNEAVEAQGIGDKIQLLMARLAPAERTPKAFSDRPDPFDRLAAEVQRASGRKAH